MRALTANETTILKSKFQAGASGHSQQVVLTANVPTNAAVNRNPYFPWVVRLPNSEAGMLYRADANLADPPSYRVYFHRYVGQHVLAIPVELFPYDTSAFGLVTYRGTLLAVCWSPTTGLLRYRTSTDSGINWTAEASMGLTYTAGQLAKAGNHVPSPAFQMVTSKDGLTLYLFSCVDPWGSGIAGIGVQQWRQTTNPNVTLGWTALANTGLTATHGRNYGGPSARNQGVQRAWIMCETKTAGTWVGASEMNDLDWHANHGVVRGTLGGAWSIMLNVGYGGGLSGGQGANGGIFYDRNGDLIFYVMDDNGTSVGSSLSTNSGATWTTLREEMPLTGAELGGGSGCSIPGYDSVEYLWGHVAGGGVAIGTTHYGGGGDWARIYGSGVAASYTTFTTTSVDVSDRVIAISIQKDTSAHSSSVSVELRNNDGALSVNDAAAALNVYARPNVKIEVYQWHGVVANKVKTFTGLLDSVADDAGGSIVTISGRDMAKKLIVQEVVPTAPQTLAETGYVRDMGNFVYLNKTLAEVLADLLLKTGTLFTLTVAPSTYVFREIRFASGTLMDAALETATAAGMTFWADEDGAFRAGLVAGPQAASSWTYRSREDVYEFTTDLSDDGLITRVRLMGPANIGAKYLKEQFIWASPAAGPRGVAYDPTTGHIWLLAANRWLSRLNPASNMAVVESFDLSSIITYPDSLAVGPDGHLWIADGFDATDTANANRKFRKVSRTAPLTTLVGPITNPDSLHVRLWHDGTQLRMATHASPSALVTVNATTGAEISRVVSPVNFPMGFDTDGQGGAFLTGWEQTDMFQVSLAGSIVNTIKQPAKNSNEFGYDSSDSGLYAVFVEQDTIVKYAVAGTPSEALTATYAIAIDDALERELIGEKRWLTVVDLNITDMAQATSSAERILAARRQTRKRTTAGAVGNPGLQLNDRVTMYLPGHGVASSDWMVRSIRSDQQARSGTYLMMLVVEPYSAAF